MRDVSDMSLLQDYNRHASEEAFAELVRRHVNLVYSAALRRTGIPAHAEEIAQAVFVILARKAGSLRPDTVLEAWLYETTRLTSISFLRGERRRQFREQEAYMQSTIQEHADVSTWSQFAPLLDDAMAWLGKKDREAVVLRFFKQKNLREVAIALNLTESAAQSRVHRALEKLRRYFSKRGIVSTTAIIASEISAHSVHAAPASLAKTISAIAVAKGATASTSTLTLIKGALKIMAWTKMKTTVAATAIVLLAAAGTTTVVVKQIADHQNEDWRFASSDPKYLSALPYRTLILPTKAVSRSRSLASTAAVIMRDGRAYGVAYPIEWILRLAYFKPEVLGDDFVFSPVRTILNTKLPTRRYDFFSNWPTGAREALQAEIQRKFGLSAQVQPIATNVLLLEVKNSNSTDLEPQPILRGRAPYRGFRRNARGMSAEYVTMNDLANRLEQMLRIPIVNQTGLTNRYGFTLSWTNYSGPYFELNGVQQPVPTLARLKQALPDQLGLELVPTNMPVEMLVVNKAD